MDQNPTDGPGLASLGTFMIFVGITTIGLLAYPPIATFFEGFFWNHCIVIALSVLEVFVGYTLITKHSFAMRFACVYAYVSIIAKLLGFILLLWFSIEQLQPSTATPPFYAIVSDTYKTSGIYFYAIVNTLKLSALAWPFFILAQLNEVNQRRLKIASF